MGFPSTPEGWFTETSEPHDWSGYLQQHLVHPGVIVSKLHPITGLRWAAAFTRLAQEGRAGRVQVLSGVRTKEQQIALYNQICLVENRCGYVANPHTDRGADHEGIHRFGSDHMSQLQPWGEERGYAVDLSSSIAWSTIASTFDSFGLQLTVLSPLEEWHRAAESRSFGWFDAPALPNNGFPMSPGIYRTLSKGLRGGDVAALQRQLRIGDDGNFGGDTETAVRATQSQLARPVTGTWSAADQRAATTRVDPTPRVPTIEEAILRARRGVKSANDLVRAAIDLSDDPAVEVELVAARNSVSEGQRALLRALSLAD